MMAGSRACRGDILVHFHQVTDQYLVTVASHFETQHDMEAWGINSGAVDGVDSL